MARLIPDEEPVTVATLPFIRPGDEEVEPLYNSIKEKNGHLFLLEKDDFYPRCYRLPPYSNPYATEARPSLCLAKPVSAEWGEDKLITRR